MPNKYFELSVFSSSFKVSGVLNSLHWRLGRIPTDDAHVGLHTTLQDTKLVRSEIIGSTIRIRSTYGMGEHNL